MEKGKEDKNPCTAHYCYCFFISSDFPCNREERKAMLEHCLKYNPDSELIKGKLDKLRGE